MRASILHKILMLCLLVALAMNAFASEPDPPSKGADVILFWGQGCPHCAREKEFLDGLAHRHPNLRVRDFEVWANRENAEAFAAAVERLGIGQAAVPVTLIGNRVFVGFSESTEREIERIASGLGPDEGAPLEIDLPVVGTIQGRDYSLIALTILIGGLDSFNPCALYVLMFLLSFLVHARSRGRMLLVGGTFILFSGGMYFMFMAAWLNLFFLAGRIWYATAAAGAVALVAGGINIKDYFAFRQGVSLTLSDRQKSSLLSRMRGLMSRDSTVAMLAGAAALAIIANMYELLCTAGLPMLYTRVLTLRHLAPVEYYTWLALYNVVYVIPLAAVVGVFTATLGARKLTEGQGRRLKLISGFMMVALGGALLLKPDLLNSPLWATAIMAASVGGAFILDRLAGKAV